MDDQAFNVWRKALDKLGAPQHVVSFELKAMAYSPIPTMTVTYYPENPDGTLMRDLETADALATLATEFVLLDRDLYERLPEPLKWIIANRLKYGRQPGDAAFDLEFKLK